MSGCAMSLDQIKEALKQTEEVHLVTSIEPEDVIFDYTINLPYSGIESIIKVDKGTYDKLISMEENSWDLELLIYFVLQGMSIEDIDTKNLTGDLLKNACFDRAFSIQCEKCHVSFDTFKDSMTVLDYNLYDAFVEPHELYDFGNEVILCIATGNMDVLKTLESTCSMLSGKLIRGFRNLSAINRYNPTYVNHGPDELNSIHWGVSHGLDVSIYDSKRLSSKVMDAINNYLVEEPPSENVIWLKDTIDSLTDDKDCYSDYKIYEIVKGLQSIKDINKVKKYTKDEYNYKQMREYRLTLEKYGSIPTAWLKPGTTWREIYMNRELNKF